MSYVLSIQPGSVFNEEGLEIGPIPKGTPINLLSNIDLDKREGLVANLKHKRQIVELLIKIKKDLKGTSQERH